MHLKKQGERLVFWGLEIMSTPTTEMEDGTIDLKYTIKAEWTVLLSKNNEIVLPATVMVALDSV